MRKRTIISIMITLLVLYLTNKFWFIYETNTFSHFEFEIFTIILVLTFLFTYKLTDYLADFKTLKYKSRIEIVFLSIFFILLFIPMSYINQDKKSIQEKPTKVKIANFFAL